MLKVSVFISACVLSILIISNTTFAKTAQSAVVVRTSNMKASASFSADTLKQVKLGYAVYILKKQGGWLYVQGKSDKKRGWLRTYQIRKNVSAKQLRIAQKKSPSSALAGISRSTTALFGSSKKQKEQKGGVVATLGVRGLSEQELQEAKPNPAELKRMQSYASNKSTAATFAAQARLTGVK